MLPLAGRREGSATLGLAVPSLQVRTLGAALLYLGLFCISLLQFTDPDFWWHLRTGQLIVETGSIPHHDPFSFTAQGSAWVTHEWLSEVVIYGVNEVAGYVGNAVLFSGVALLALLVMHRLVLRLGLAELPALGLVALAGTIALPFWTVRPQAFTWLLTAVFLYTLYRHYREGQGFLWHLPLLMILWANLHAGYVIGLVLVGLWLASLAAERVIWHEPRDLRGPALVSGACLLATVVNPNGPALLTYPLTYLAAGNASLNLITEWQSPDFHEALHLPLAAGIVVLALVGVIGGRRNVFRVGLALLFTFFALQSSRHQPLFALVLVVVAGDVVRERWQWAREGGSAEGSGGPSALNWAILATALVVAAAALPQLPEAQVHQEPVTSGTPAYPVEGAAFVREHYPEARMFNEYAWGGYLINELYPEQRVFIDGRPDMYGDEFVRDYIRVVSLEPEWRDILARHGVDLAIIERDSALATVLEDGADWELAFSGPVEAVFVRSGSARAQ